LKYVIGNITSHQHGNVYAEEYTQQFANAVDSSEKLGAYLDNVTLKNTWNPQTNLARQFHQVARLIATRTAGKQNGISSLCRLVVLIPIKT